MPTKESVSNIVDSGFSSSPDASIGGLWESLESCELTGRFYIDMAELQGLDCERQDTSQGQLIEVVEEAGTARLKLGSINLRVSELNNCEAKLSGCMVDQNEGNHLEHSGRLSRTAKGIRINLNSETYRAWRRLDCEGAMVEAHTATNSCQLLGNFSLAENATLTSGLCDLTWPAAKIHISRTSDEEGLLLWGASGFSIKEFDHVEFDEQTCKLEAGRKSILVSNGVFRETTIAASLDGDELSLIITDELDGVDDFGNQCNEGVFEANAQRVVPSAEPWSDSCESLPYICGDSICSAEGGENCSNCQEDCGCADSDFCYRHTIPGQELSFACTRPCDADPSVCNEGETCLLAQEFGGGVDLVDKVCLPGERASGEIGSACTSSFDCGDELICSDGACLTQCAGSSQAGCSCKYRYGVYACHLSCSRTMPDNCGPGGHCGETLGARQCTGSDSQTCYPHADHENLACFPGPSTFGDACPRGIGCGLDLACIGENCQFLQQGGVECEVETCSRSCSTAADCAAPLPYCWTNTINGQSFCVSNDPN